MTTLATGQVGPVIAVTDLERARDFYEHRLGLAGEPAPGGWVVRAGQNTVCYLLPGIDDAGSASWPVASFRVADLRASVRTLRDRGVAFLGPDDVPFTLDADGISADTAGMLVAWMRDPDGSILTVYSLADEPADAESDLRALVQERVDAVQAKDAARLAGRHDPDVLAFNVLAPLVLRGRDAVDEQTRAWFDLYPDGIGYAVRDLTVTVDADVGFCSFLYRVTGMLTDGTQVEMWVRATLGCRREQGRWRIVHDHESVPFDPETGQALIDLEP